MDNNNNIIHFHSNPQKITCIQSKEFDYGILSLCKWSDHLFAISLNTTENSIQIYSFPSLQLVRTLNKHYIQIWKWYLHKHSHSLISWGCDYDICIWNYSTGKCLAVLSGHNDEVTDIAELNNGNILTVSHDKSIRFWDFNSRSCLRVVHNIHNKTINDILILNNDLLLTGGDDCFVKVWTWDLVNVKRDLITILHYSSSVKAMIIVKDKLLVSTFKLINVYATKDFTELFQWREISKIENSLVWWLNGSVVICNGDMDTTIVWDWDNNKEVCRWYDAGEEINGVVEWNERVILSWGANKKLKLWNWE